MGKTANRCTGATLTQHRVRSLFGLSFRQDRSIVIAHTHYRLSSNAETNAGMTRGAPPTAARQTEVRRTLDKLTCCACGEEKTRSMFYLPTLKVLDQSKALWSPVRIVCDPTWKTTTVELLSNPVYVNSKNGRSIPSYVVRKSRRRVSSAVP